MELIVGLGNPGQEYECTRHNLGFVVIDKIAYILGLKFRVSNSLEAEITPSAQPGKLYLLKPLTYMNLSGTSVLKVIKKYSIEPKNILVISDDFSLPLGKLRIRLQGSSGGHNGIESVISSLGVTDFPRLRLGIGPVPDVLSDSKDFVLGRFKPDERLKVGKMTDFAAASALEFCNCIDNPSALLEKINSYKPS
ncbi:MAG: aminoacyl-tRNA hydrolase [Elusimicrobia bacterium RIFOXYA2_FULL_40_6]|nr:MAG: aminoacyl-tRNA hydrolase [Elusimicrobia bacterium RIFOXYA2_FULL_40_6]